MLIAIKVVAIALAALLANTLLNQLPTLRDFKGKTGILIRLILVLTWIAATDTVLKSEASEVVKVVFRYGSVAAVVALLYDASALVKGVRQAKLANSTESAAGALTDSQSLQARLVKEVRFRVRERLDYAVGQKSLMEVPMEPVPDEVGRLARPEVEAQPPQDVFTLVRRQVLKLLGKGQSESLDVSNILEAFNHEHVSRKLLILGEPGAGKTTALLTLAEALLDQTAGTVQFPYIFELSAWDGAQDILPWLTAQLKFDYGIDERVSREWISNRQLVPLLDGLDELNMKVLPQCVAKINDFAALPDQSVVVCCRSEEYAQGAAKLKALRGALRLQPLSDGQIEQYLNKINRQDIWQAMQTQPELVALLTCFVNEQGEEEPAFLRVPLLLKMLVTVYQRNRSIASKKELFDAYIDRQLSEGSRLQARQSNRETREGLAYDSGEDEPSLIETKRYLSWLARRLKETNSANNFLIEQMQPG